MLNGASLNPKNCLYIKKQSLPEFYKIPLLKVLQNNRYNDNILTPVKQKQPLNNETRHGVPSALPQIGTPFCKETYGRSQSAPA